MPACFTVPNKSRSSAHRLRSSSAIAALVAIGAVSLGASVPALAADWTGAVSSDWFIAGNWGPAAVPTAATSVSIDTLAANPAAIGVGGAAFADTLYIADPAGTSGALTISAGGDLTVSVVSELASGAGTTASAIITGSGSAWTTNGAAIIGRQGAATLDILAGGVMNNSGATIGQDAGSSGVVAIDGSGSAWLNGAGGLTVGNAGDGTVNITGGGTVVDVLATLGVQAGATGTVSVAGPGSTWLNLNSLNIGRGGAGFLAIASGGTVSNSTGSIAVLAGSIGGVTVDGPNSEWTNTANLSVGASGTGSLAITNGGAVSSIGGTVGGNAGSSGAVTVDGLNSQWTSSILDVGYSGAGSLSITNGGTVTSLTGSVGNNAGSSGAMIVDGSGSAWNSAGTIEIGRSGTGSLAITHGGSVSGGAAYVGEDMGTTGTVIVDGAGSAWSSSQFMQLGSGGAGVMTVSGGSSVSVANTLTIAVFAPSTGVLNIGAAAGSAAAAAGSVTAASLAFGAGAGTINFNHTDTNYTLAAPISGLGTLNQIAGVTKLTGNSSGFTGVTNVTGGSLYVNGSLGGAVVVAGGFLGGSGTFGDLEVGPGGTVAPGNSIGTVNVANALFVAGSTYVVELNDAGKVAGVNNDLINASGSVDINGGSVHVTPVNGTDNGSSYTPGAYTIISAAGGVNGTFAAVSDDYAFLDFALSYDPGTVILTSALATPGVVNSPFCLANATANQCAAGNGVFSLGSGSLYSAVLVLSAAEAPAALDMLSGEVHASARTGMIEDSRFAREAALDRLRTALGGVGATAPATQATPDGANLWIEGFGSRADWASDGNAAAMSRSIGGLFMGADAEIAADVHAGLMGGYSRSGSSVADRLFSTTMDSYTVGAYAGGGWDDFSLKGGLAQTWHSAANVRSVTFTGFADSLSGSSNARTFQAYTEAAYSIEVGNARFEPFANLALVSLATDAFAETGGAAALSGDGSSMGTTFTTIGIRAETAVALGETSAMLTGGLGWRHAFGDTPASTHAFAGGTAFTVTGVPLARDVLMLEAGIDVNLTDTAMLALSYAGQLGSSLADHSAKAGFGVKF